MLSKLKINVIIIPCFILICHLLSISYAYPDTNTPTIVIKNTLDNLFLVLKRDDLKAPGFKRQRREAVKEAISISFNFGEMAKRTLGRHWRTMTESERDEFTVLFSTFLSMTYGDKIEEYNNEEVIFKKEFIDGRRAEVHTDLIHNGVAYPMHYRLLNDVNTKAWFIYDIVIDGISLIVNYRSQFNGIMREDGVKGLFRRLSEKLNEKSF